LKKLPEVIKLHRVPRPPRQNGGAQRRTRSREQKEKENGAGEKERERKKRDEEERRRMNANKSENSFSRLLRLAQFISD